MLKEKEALEASLQAISGGGGSGAVPVMGGTGEGVRNREQSPAHLEAQCEGEGGREEEAGRRTTESETDETSEGQTGEPHSYGVPTSTLPLVLRSISIISISAV